MIILRQKEFARAISKEALVRELERRGFKSGVSKYISKGYRTVKNPDYVNQVESAWQKAQTRGTSPNMREYLKMGPNQRINLKGTLEADYAGGFNTNVASGGKIKWKRGVSRSIKDHPSSMVNGISNRSPMEIATRNNWNLGY